MNINLISLFFTFITTSVTLANTCLVLYQNYQRVWFIIIYYQEEGLYILLLGEYLLLWFNFYKFWTFHIYYHKKKIPFLPLCWSMSILMQVVIDILQSSHMNTHIFKYVETFLEGYRMMNFVLRRSFIIITYSKPRRCIWCNV